MDDCDNNYLPFYSVMSGNIRYWGYVSGVVACTLRTIKGATDVWNDDDNRAAETAIQEKINIEFSDIYDR